MQVFWHIFLDENQLFSGYKNRADSYAEPPHFSVALCLADFMLTQHRLVLPALCADYVQHQSSMTFGHAISHKK